MLYEVVGINCKWEAWTPERLLERVYTPEVWIVLLKVLMLVCESLRVDEGWLVSVLTCGGPSFLLNPIDAISSDA